MTNTIENEYELLSVGEIVKKMPRAAGVFSALKIDFFCGGNKKFKEAYQKKGTNSDEVWEQINVVQQKGNATTDLESVL